MLLFLCSDIITNKSAIKILKKRLTGKIPALIAFNFGFMASYLESEATCTCKPEEGNIFIRLKAALINNVKDNCVMGKSSLPQTHNHHLTL